MKPNAGIVINHLADATQRRLKAQTVWDKVRRQQGKPVEQIISLPEISGHPQIQDLRIALIQTRRNLSEAAKHYGPQHPKYLQAQRSCRPLTCSSAGTGRAV